MKGTGPTDPKARSIMYHHKLLCSHVVVVSVANAQSHDSTMFKTRLGYLLCDL